MREDVQNGDVPLSLTRELWDIVRDGALHVQEPTILENRDRERYDRFRCRHYLERGSVCDRNGVALAGAESPGGSHRHVEQLVALRANDKLASGECPFLLLSAEELFSFSEHFVA